MEKGRHAREDARGYVERNKHKNGGNCGLKECARHCERKNPNVKNGKRPTCTPHVRKDVGRVRTRGILISTVLATWKHKNC